MSLLVATDKYIALAKGLHIDYYNYTDHKVVDIPLLPKHPENDYISDIAVSNDAKRLALVTAFSKQLMVYDLCKMEHQTTSTIPRTASRIKFTEDNTKVLVADKSGDVLIYDLKIEGSGTKLLGHLSVLLDVLLSNDSKYILSCDRDEKIRVSCYPNTYKIQTYCLGHTEFVNHMEFLPHNDKYLTSSSGDGTLKIWDYNEGKLCHTIHTKSDVNDEQLRRNFINVMDEGGIEVTTLPIVHYTTTKINNTSSLLAVTLHSYNAVILYSVKGEDNLFSHKLERKLELPRFPAAIKVFNNTLFVYDDVELNINVFNMVIEHGQFSIEEPTKIAMFENKNIESESVLTQLESVKVLYKRKFDNVREYHERKKQRLERTTK